VTLRELQRRLSEDFKTGALNRSATHPERTIGDLPPDGFGK
jgi:hypothetical protein